jgi:hypothetical protein
VLGTFAENGPTRCCALDVKRYSFNDLERKIGDKFHIEKMINSIHQTPFKTEQSFNFIQAIKR